MMYSYRKSYLIRNSAYLIMLVLFFKSFNLDAQENWELQKDEDNIKIYTQNVEGSAYKKFKAETVFNCTPADMVAILRDVQKYPKWVADCEKVELMEQDTTSQYHYIETVLPWPFENRDMVYHFKYTGLSEQTIEVSIKGVPGYTEEKKGVVRMNKVDGSWLFRLTENNTTEVIYMLYSEPGGAIPAWLANTTVVDMPFNTITELRKIAEK